QRGQPEQQGQPEQMALVSTSQVRGNPPLPTTSMTWRPSTAPVTSLWRRIAVRNLISVPTLTSSHLISGMGVITATDILPEPTFGRYLSAHPARDNLANWWSMAQPTGLPQVSQSHFIIQRFAVPALMAPCQPRASQRKLL